MNLFDIEDAARLLPYRPADGHKGTFGKVCVIGGSVGYTGAPVMSATGAQRCGSGLVFLAVPESIYQITASRCLEVMPFPVTGHNGRISNEAFDVILDKAEGCDAVLIGPGLGRSIEISTLVCRLIEHITKPLVLDADALYAVKDDKNLLVERADKRLVTVITPHEGEFAYLDGDISGGRRQGALAFAEKYGCVTVLKGPATVTAYQDGRVYINTTGNNGMAKGGSGDILAGMTLSFLGQGMDCVEAAALAVFIHGLAGDIAARKYSEYAMLPSDILSCIPDAFLKIQAV